MKRISSLFSSSSSSYSAGSLSSAKPSSRSRSRPTVIGRNASCLDAEYWTPPPPPAVVPATLPAALTDLFRVFDRNRDGKISKEELGQVMGRLRSVEPLTEDELATMMAAADRDGDGCISLDEFRALATALPRPAHDDLREAFCAFDTDGDGRISAEELLSFFISLGDDRCTLDDCRGMILSVDSRGDGYVVFDDFARMMS